MAGAKAADRGWADRVDNLAPVDRGEARVGNVARCRRNGRMWSATPTSR